MTITRLSKLKITCMQNGKTKYSSIPCKALPSLEINIAKYIRTIGTVENAVPRQILTNSSHIYWMYVNAQGTFQALHSMVPYDDENVLCYIGAHGDDILNTLCVKIPTTAFGACVLTVIPKDKLGPIRSWGTVANDCLPDSFVSGSDPDTPVGGAAIGHDGTVATIPYISAIPLLFPTLSPMAINHDIGQPLPGSTYSPSFAGFHEGVKFLRGFHEGKSIHVGDHLFAEANWTGEGLGVTILADLPSGPDTGLMENMDDPCSWVDPDSIPAAACSDLMDESKCTKLREFTESVAPEHLPPPGPSQQGPAALGPEFNLLLGSLTKSMEVKPTVAQNKVGRGIQCWSVLLARESIDEATGEKIAVPAVMNEDFVHAMGQNGDYRVTLTNQLLSSKLAAQKQERTSVGTRAQFAPGQIGRFECSLISEYVVMQGPLSSYSDNLDLYISIFNFLRIDMNDQHFRNRVQSDRTYDMQLRHEADPAKRKKAATGGYVEGSQCERDDHLVAPNNKLLLLMTMSSEALHSVVYGMIDTLLRSFETSTCCLWVDRHRGTHRHIGHTLLAMVQDCLAPFYALGSDPKLLRLAANGENLPIEGFIAAKEIALTNIYHMNLDIRSNSLGRMENMPFTFKWFPRLQETATIQPVANYTESSVLGKRAADRGMEQTTAKKPAAEVLVPEIDKRPPPGAGPPGGGQNNKKKKGILICKTKPKPILLHPIGKLQTRLCIMHVYEGMVCGYGKKCKFAHVNHFSELSDKEAKVVCKFVQDNKDVEFAPDAGARCPRG